MKIAKWIASLALVAGGIGALAYGIYPTHIRAVSLSRAGLDEKDYASVVLTMQKFAESQAHRGVTSFGDPATRGLSGLECQGVPLLTALIIDDRVLLQISALARVRARALDVVLVELGPLLGEDLVAKANTVEDSHSQLETFVLKHRDGIDLQADCN
jgi:hypothetical protein